MTPHLQSRTRAPVVSRAADVLLLLAMALVALAGLCLHGGWPLGALAAGLLAAPFALVGAVLRIAEHLA